ncbi:von Willebrand factor A domain-containing protein 3B isoform X2 [Phyllobates terribilis]|uniref:von Willebrand factor A domain-containing protein 3B isoform X2 n=1 Tax=Phyllobates terribilis TaxID=111132 RepID=UPI003CCAF1AB
MEATAQVSSTLWLQSYGLSKKKLTMPKILARLGFQQKQDYVNNLGRPVSSRYSHGLFQQYTCDGKIYNLTAKKEDILKKIESVTDVIELYKRRLDWLNSSSQSAFGVVQEQSAVIILDLSAPSKVQHNLCREAICLVIKEQIRHISKFNLILVSQEPVKWHEKAMRVTQRSIEEAMEWIWNLQPSSVASMDSAAEAVAEALDNQVEAIYYFSVGDAPVAKIQKLKQTIENSPCPLHVVCYNPHKAETITMMSELSLQTSGRFHIHLEKSKEDERKTNQSKGYPDMPEASKVLAELDLKKDELLIRTELSEAQENLNQLQDIWKTFYNSEDEKNFDTRVEETLENCVSSKEWLEEFGLKPQKLLFYDALADCAFRHSDGVVDIKTKPEDESIQTDAENNLKMVNAKYCDRFVHVLWKDDSVVHVHISKEKCRWYEEKLRTALDKMIRRVQWLQNGSRELFGSILEDQVYILIDTSHSMKDKLFLLKEKILQLLQEQLKHKRMFNFVKFDSKVEAWKPKLVAVNEENIKEAWSWIKELQVGSSTNTLKALQVALTDSNTQAVYLLTDGRPNQPTDTILNQVTIINQIPIHTISFNCDDTEANSFLYEISSKTGGRFHTYSSYLKDPDAPQPFVSEDIQLLLNEIEEGQSTFEKIKKLHTECLMLDWYRNGDTDLPQRTFQKQNHTRMQSAHELRSSNSSSLLHGSSLSPPWLHKRKKKRHAEQTRSSLLRALSHGVRLSESAIDLHIPSESKELFLNMDKKTASVLKELNLIEGSKVQEKVKKLPKTSLDISSSRWLKTYGLIPRRLTIMDALAPTTVPHSAKYVPILQKHIVSKVFDEVLPLAHISGNRKRITLINPQAVNLSDYKEKLQQAIKSYERRLSLIVWRALSQEERDNFDSDVPISYLDNKEALLQALDRLGWPVSADDVMLLEEEIQAGKTYLQQALDLQETTMKKTVTENSDTQTNHEENETLKIKEKSKRTFLDTLRGQKVIARSEIDGFYYAGTVLKSINSRRALVDFWLGENEVVPIRFIIQTGGAIPWPTLKVGDCVFSKTGARGGGGGCYVPAVVIATPRTDAADKLYSVLKYNNRKEHCLRSQLIKISPSQFAVSCGYIRKAQMIDFTIPSVQLAKPLLKPTPPKEEKKHQSVSRRSRRSVVNHFGSRTPSDNDSLASNDGTDRERKILNENIMNKLEDLALQVTQYQNEQKENQKAIQVYIEELKEHNSHRDTRDFQEDEQDTAKQKINMVEQLKLLIPIRKTEKEKDEIPVLSTDPLPLPGKKVLSICSHNGWYEEGSIIHDCGDSTYFVEKPSGEVARIHRDDLLTDTDDYKKEIKESDPVIGPHPLHPGSYCPGVALHSTPDLKVPVRYYDSVEACAPREYIYSVCSEKYKKTTSYILECEKRWVGQPVVARNDETGTFHLAEVKKQTDNHKKYVISWADGTTAVQDMEWIFGKFSKPHVLNVGDHVLTLAYPSSLTFLPGIVTVISGTMLQILFCNGKRCQNMEAHHCFGLSKKAYDDAVQFYYENNQAIDSDEDLIISANEDSRSDVSSFTISSVDTERKLSKV